MKPQTPEHRAESLIAGLRRTAKQWADLDQDIDPQLVSRVRYKLARAKQDVKTCLAALEVLTQDELEGQVMRLNLGDGVFAEYKLCNVQRQGAQECSAEFEFIRYVTKAD